MHESIEFTGLALIIVAVLGRTWSTLYIGGKKNGDLVHNGPYSMCRNPLYVFSVIGATGMGMVSGTITGGLVTGLACFLVFDRVIRKEESFLTAHFGAPYRHYLDTVPRWLPNPALWHDVEETVVRPKLVLTTFRDACIFLLAYPFFEFVEKAQLVHIAPILAHVP
ncbi:methyltransferase family protein [Aestuariispira ectoiniformans]|uniref:methyltransferase family protein n=1 Tax=Aestuariispira ectoiniformans TaxID=2775080 RepID=UPI00223ABDA3|nr:isoprenylcysteine carboxylmethyltransferase family protein [Aestuariispira ectoiniformans]